MVLAATAVLVALVGSVALVQTATQAARAMAVMVVKVDVVALVVVAPVAQVVLQLASGALIVRRQLSEQAGAVFYLQVASVVPHVEVMVRPVCAPHTSIFSSSSRPLHELCLYSP